MEKWKVFWYRVFHWSGWKTFLRWEGWGRLARWKGWTGWLHWPGWQQLLFPGTLPVVGLTVASAAGLVWIFFTGRELAWFAYPIYCVAFYALETVTALMIQKLPGAKRRMEENTRIQRLRAKNADGAFSIGFYLEQFVNFFYGFFKIVSGIAAGSAWIGADGIYNFVQALIQLYQILRHRQAKTIKQQWQSYRQCGFMMIVLHLTMTGMMYQMIQMGRHEDHSEIMIISTAAFTFYKLIKTFVDVAKDRKHEKPVDSAVRFLDLSQALYNLFVLQVGLISVYGGADFTAAELMNNLTACAVCLLVLGMGINMIRRANRDMKQWEETIDG